MGIETIALIAIAAGGAVSAYSSIQQGKQQEKQYQYKAKVEKNKAMAERSAARLELDQKRRRTRMVKGKQATAAAKSGTTLSGSIKDIMFETSIDSELDQLATVYQSQTSSTSRFADARMFQQSGKFAKQQGYLNAASTILTTAGSMASYGGGGSGGAN